MKLALMAEPGQIGNGEPRIGSPGKCQTPASGAKKEQKKRTAEMTISARPMPVFVDFRRKRSSLKIFALAVVAAKIGAPNTADARSVRPARAYDGTWNVFFSTRAGNCSSTNSAPFAVSRGRVSSAGVGEVTGGVSSAGTVSVRISLGQSVASGSGRLVGNSGAGRWSGVISGDRCSGSWRATRG
jgi:hypothetical protein